MKDKYSAIWVSHSSMNDYLKCPRAYYLRNVYRDPKTHKKVSIMQPALALGQTVHDVIDEISNLPVEARFSEPIARRFDKHWQKVQGLKGGFRSDGEERSYKERGLLMVKRIQDNPGPLLTKAVKIRQELPYFWLSEEDNIILCGKIDWLQYIETTDSVKIIDFKTGKYDEDPDSLQLPIYCMLASNTQKRPVSGIAYWYLDRDAEPIDGDMPDMDGAKQRVLEIAKTVALARKLERFICKSKDGCVACRPYEAIVNGKATHVGVNDFGQEIYVLNARSSEERQ